MWPFGCFTRRPSKRSYQRLVQRANNLLHSPPMKDGPTRRFRRALRKLDKFRWSQSAEWGNPAIAQDCANLIFRRGEAQGGAEVGLSLFLMCCWIDRQKPYEVVWSRLLRGLDYCISDPHSADPPGLPEDRNHVRKTAIVRASRSGGIAGWFAETVLEIVKVHGRARGNIYRFMGRMLRDILDVRSDATLNKIHQLCDGQRVPVEFKRAWMAVMMLRRDQKVIRRLLQRALRGVPHGRLALRYWHSKAHFRESECELPVDGRMLSIFSQLFLGEYSEPTDVIEAASRFAAARRPRLSPSAFDALFFGLDRQDME